MRNESQARGWSDPNVDARSQAWPMGGDSDVPGYAWRDSGAGSTTGRDFGPSGWPGDRWQGDPSGGWNQTSEPGPSRRWDDRQAPEQTSGLDRPPQYRAVGRTDFGYRAGDRYADDAYAGEDYRDPYARDDYGHERGRRGPGMPPQRFGDRRYGRPDEWSSRQPAWPGRPSRYEDANSGYGMPPSDAGQGAGMGAGMYWSGESAREDDDMRDRMAGGRQVPTQGMLEQRSSGHASRQPSFAGRGPRGYQRSDERIAEDVSDRLTEDEYLDASDISVTIQQGTVVLEGTVDTRDSRRRAEDVAASVSGVRDVMNRLSVRESAGGLQEAIRNWLG